MQKTKDLHVLLLLLHLLARYSLRLIFIGRENPSQIIKDVIDSLPAQSSLTYENAKLKTFPIVCNDW